ncbi:nucleotide-diphosphate-sugar epimerase [Planobispora rosea]|uniref:Nucleotide-diphosphate-sugar epimerase n=1 Tax=Planobispora rosea TaxID=35762 RepID=A0A8J3S2B6_PLARO|nr:NAD(P)H-binding protein [Planobispora rosea]GGS93140.1 nucleotide-diphosphate-sugar epimerase [Planobispora rosea]GIH87176.1 nucleotide-diphosphate-sugar epimerase [Planobispora rosea]
MTILVTGATGVVGRGVVGELLRAGRRVRALTRRPAAARLPGEVEVYEGDLEHPESLRAALAGVERLYLFPVARTAAEVVALAAESGVRRIVDLSGAGADDETFEDGYRVVERAVEASGLDWTHVRPGEFAANWLDWAPSIRAERTVRRPHGGAVTQPTHEADVAAVAAAALLGDGHEGRTYTFAGPEALTVVEQVEAIGRAIGERVRFEEQDPVAAREQWIRDGYPAEVVDWLFGMWAASARDPAPVDEEWACVVPRLTGRPARTFSEWAAENAAAFS